MSDPGENTHTVRALIYEEGRKQIMRWLFLAIGAAALALLTPIGSKLIRIWNSPDRLEKIDGTLEKMNDTLMTFTGKSRVTKQPDDMSYVREPVRLGEPILLVLFIGRTEVGYACILREIIPQFTDENNVTLSLAPRRPRIQLGPDVVRRLLHLDQPDGLVVGRTRVQLQLEYQCGERTLFEMTKPVFFYALPAA